MTAKLAVKFNKVTFNYDKVAKDLANIRASLTTDNTVNGVVGNDVAPETVQNAMNKLMKLATNNYGSSLSEAIFDARNDRGIVNSDTAMSILKGRCLKDMKNAEYEDNVKDSIALRNVSEGVANSYVNDSNHIYDLTASDVLEVISDMAFNDDFTNDVKKHSVHAYKVISQL